MEGRDGIGREGEGGGVGEEENVQEDGKIVLLGKRAFGSIDKNAKQSKQNNEEYKNAEQIEIERQSEAKDGGALVVESGEV